MSCGGQSSRGSRGSAQSRRAVGRVYLLALSWTESSTYCGTALVAGSPAGARLWQRRDVLEAAARVAAMGRLGKRAPHTAELAGRFGRGRFDPCVRGQHERTGETGGRNGAESDRLRQGGLEVSSPRRLPG